MHFADKLCPALILFAPPAFQYKLLDLEEAVLLCWQINTNALLKVNLRIWFEQMFSE